VRRWILLAATNSRNPSSVIKGTKTSVNSDVRLSWESVKYTARHFLSTTWVQAHLDLVANADAYIKLLMGVGPDSELAAAANPQNCPARLAPGQLGRY
jgi:hypothetical protein